MAKPIASTPPLKSKDFLKLLKEDETPATKLEGKVLEQELEKRKTIRDKFEFGENVSF